MRPKVSWDGMPPGSARNVRSHVAFARPNVSTATHPSAPQITAHNATVMMSSSR